MTSLQHLTVVNAHDSHTPLLTARLASSLVFDCRDDFATQLTNLARTLPACERTLDFVGQTNHERLLVCDGKIFDARIGRFRAYHRGLAEQEVLPRLGITSIRLVGCTTDVGEHARATLAILSELYDLEVTGTSELVSARDFTAAGFVLPDPAPWPAGRYLDLDGLDRLAHAPGADARALTFVEARDVLAAIRRDAGIDLPGLLALPHARIALPAAGGAFHHLELLLDHELVRAGTTVWPVEDPRALRKLLDR